MENEALETHLKHVFEGIDRLLASAYEVSTPFSHKAIGVSILFPG